MEGLSKGRTISLRNFVGEGITTRGGGLVLNATLNKLQITLTYIYSTCYFEKNIF